MDVVVFDMTKIWGEKMEPYYEKLEVYKYRNGMYKNLSIYIVRDEPFNNLERITHRSISQLFPIRLVLQEISRHVFEIEKMHAIGLDFFQISITEHLNQIELWKYVLWYMVNYKIRHNIKDDLLEQFQI